MLNIGCINRSQIFQNDYSQTLSLRRSGRLPYLQQCKFQSRIAQRIAKSSKYLPKILAPFRLASSRDEIFAATLELINKSTLDRALVVCVITSNNEILSLLIEHESDYELERILTYASWNGKLESVKMLICAGVDVNRKKFRYMFSPLECAAFNGHEEIAKILTEAGGKLV